MNILLVDDEPTYRILAGDFLKSQGWKVFLAAHGEEGLKVLESQKIDLIVTDIYMPVMDGLKFRKAVRDNPAYENIPVLFVSAYDDEYTMNAVQNAKLDGFARKALPLSHLKAWITWLMTPSHERSSTPPSYSSTTESGPHSGRMRDADRQRRR